MDSADLWLYTEPQWTVPTFTECTVVRVDAGVEDRAMPWTMVCRCDLTYSQPPQARALPAISLPPYNAHVGPQIHDDRYRRGPRVYDISALLTTSIIIGAETAPCPAQLSSPGPSLSTTGANLHTFPLRTSLPPAICSTGTNPGVGPPARQFSGRFRRTSRC